MTLTAPISEALDRLADRGLVAYPTETVWGLGALARSAQAVGTLRAWKGRGAAHAISVLVGNSAAIESGGFVVDDRVRRLAAAFWPGPLTIVLRCREIYAPGIANADGAIGVRCSPHPVASALATIAALSAPLARADSARDDARLVFESADGTERAVSLEALRTRCESPVIEVDEPLTAETMEAIRAIPGVLSATGVTL